MEKYKFKWRSVNSIPKSTRRHIKLDKFIFGTPWLLDLLCKHWFASSVWNFCRWVADVPPRETSSATKSEEKRMFSQASVSRNTNFPKLQNSSRAILDTYRVPSSVNKLFSFPLYHHESILLFIYFFLQISSLILLLFYFYVIWLLLTRAASNFFLLLTSRTR